MPLLYFGGSCHPQPVHCTDLVDASESCWGGKKQSSYCSASEANEEGGSFCSDSLALSLPSESLVADGLVLV